MKLQETGKKKLLLRAGSRSHHPFNQGGPGELHHRQNVELLIATTESSSQWEISLTPVSQRTADPAKIRTLQSSAKLFHFLRLQPQRFAFWIVYERVTEVPKV
jgi:hypothetical protein